MNTKKLKKDIIGNKFGRLTVLEFIGSKERSDNYHRLLRVYKCLCECGTLCEKFGVDLRAGVVISCDCYRKELQKNIHTGKISPQRNSKGAWHQTAKKIWRTSYTDGISLKEFIILSQLPCYYCGVSHSNRCNGIKNTANMDWYNRGWWNYNGLDRIDSSKDHSPNNVVPACWKCNRAKNLMNIKDFIDWISLVYNHNHLKKI